MSNDMMELGIRDAAQCKAEKERKRTPSPNDPSGWFVGWNSDPRNMEALAYLALLQNVRHALELTQNFMSKRQQLNDARGADSKPLPWFRPARGAGDRKHFTLLEFVKDTFSDRLFRYHPLWLVKGLLERKKSVYPGTVLWFIPGGADGYLNGISWPGVVVPSTVLNPDQSKAHSQFIGNSLTLFEESACTHNLYAYTTVSIVRSFRDMVSAGLSEPMAPGSDYEVVLDNLTILQSCISHRHEPRHPFDWSAIELMVAISYRHQEGQQFGMDNEQLSAILTDVGQIAQRAGVKAFRVWYDKILPPNAAGWAKRGLLPYLILPVYQTEESRCAVDRLWPSLEGLAGQLGSGVFIGADADAEMIGAETVCGGRTIIEAMNGLAEILYCGICNDLNTFHDKDYLDLKEWARGVLVQTTGDPLSSLEAFGNVDEIKCRRKDATMFSLYDYDVAEHHLIRKYKDNQRTEMRQGRHWDPLLDVFGTNDFQNRNELRKTVLKYCTVLSPKHQHDSWTSWHVLWGIRGSVVTAVKLKRSPDGDGTEVESTSQVHSNDPVTDFMAIVGNEAVAEKAKNVPWIVSY